LEHRSATISIPSVDVTKNLLIAHFSRCELLRKHPAKVVSWSVVGNTLDTLRPTADYPARQLLDAENVYQTLDSVGVWPLLEQRLPIRCNGFGLVLQCHPP